MDSDIKFRCYAGGSKITVTVRFSFSYILSWSKTTGTGSKLSKGQNQVMTGNYFPWKTDCACSLLKLLLPPSLKCALGRWLKDVLKIRDWLPPQKNYGDPTLSPKEVRNGHVYCVREKVKSSTSTSLAHMVVEKTARGTWSPFFFFFPWIPTIMLIMILVL